MCNVTTSVTSEKPDQMMNINTASVIGTTLSGCGYTHLEQITSVLNIPPMSQLHYKKTSNNFEKVVEGVLLEQLTLAGQEEAKIAIENGHVNNEGIPYITVIVDGAWSKRSYKTNYNALSGVAVIIGEATRKVLYIGVKNKFCIVCSRYERNQQNATPHACAKNWSGTSTAMESAIIVEGFSKSIEMHGIQYTKLVGDGDSSVTKKLLQVKPYGTTGIEKVECVNHLLRNMCNKLKSLSKTARSSSSQKLVPLDLRKKLENSILRFRTAIKKAATHHLNSNETHPNKLLNFQKDVRNSIDHIFGSHGECNAYFCLGNQNNEENLEPQISDCGLKQDIMSCLHRILNNSASFLLNKNNNPAEHFNSLVNKFVGGKRINYSFKSSYQTRCQVAAIAYNCKENYIEEIIKFYGQESGLYTKQFILRRKLKREKTFAHKKKSISKPKRKMICTADEDYGKVDNEISPEEFNSRKNKLESMLKKTTDEIIQLEINTRGQSSNPMWHQERAFRITASNFGRICKMRTTTNPVNMLHNLLYKTFTGNEATRYGQEYEDVAIEEFMNLTGLEVKKCGIFIGIDEDFF